MKSKSPEQKIFFELLSGKVAVPVEERIPGMDPLPGAGHISVKKSLPGDEQGHSERPIRDTANINDKESHAVEENILGDDHFQGGVLIPGTGIDYNVLLTLLKRHRQLPLAGSFLNSIPESVRGDWKSILQQKILRSHHLFAETLEIIAQFQASGIRIIPLKGAVLTYLLYGDIGARHFNDIDFLVSKNDLQKSVFLFQKLNYIQQYPDSITTRQWKTYSTYKKDIGLRNREKGIFIELHFGIYVHELLREGDESRMLDQTEKVLIKQKEVEVLDRETTFVYLVYHGCMHQYFRLFWLRDVSECLNRWELDHGKVIRLVNELGFQRLLGASLHLARYYFGTTVPTDYSPFLAPDRVITKMVDACHRRIMGPENLNLFSKPGKHIFLMKLKPGLFYKWSVLWSIMQRWRIRIFMGGH